MKVNRDNYEVFFVDYFDNKLTAEEVAELLLFLEKNTDLKEVFEEFESVALSPSNVAYEGKEKLKKQIVPIGEINESNYEDFFIEALETKEHESLHPFLAQNTFLEKELLLFEKTKLTPNYHQTYSNKEKLKKHPIIYFSNNVMRYAAAAVMLIGLFVFSYTFFKPSITPLHNNIAEEKQTSKTEEVSKKKDDVKENEAEALISENQEAEKIMKPKKVVLKKKEAELNTVTTAPKEDVIAEEKEAEKIVFAEQITLAEITKPEQSVKKLTLVSPENATLENDHQTPFDALAEKITKQKRNKNSRIDLAFAGINMINKVLGTNIQVSPKTNEEGELIAFAITSNSFELEKNVKK
jgi:hypothetical protein